MPIYVYQVQWCNTDRHSFRVCGQHRKTGWTVKETTLHFYKGSVCLLGPRKVILIPVWLEAGMCWKHWQYSSESVVRRQEGVMDSGIQRSQLGGATGMVLG